MRIKITHLYLFIFFILSSNFAIGKTFTSYSDTAWENPSTWNEATDIPGPGDDVIIRHSVTLNLSAKVTILSLKITNEDDTEARFILQGTDTLEVLGNVNGLSMNIIESVDFQISGTATLYVHGNFHYERDVTNSKNAMLRLFLYENAKATILGNFTYDYHSSNAGEGDSEVLLIGNSILEVNGTTKLNHINGSSLGFVLAQDAQVILNDSLTILETNGDGVNIIAKQNSDFSLLASAYISNTNGSQPAMIQSLGGRITIQNNVTLEATTEASLALLESKGTGSQVHVQGDILLKSTDYNAAGISLDDGDLYLGGNIRRLHDKGYLTMNSNSELILNGSIAQSIPEIVPPSTTSDLINDSISITNITFQNTSGIPMELTGDLFVKDTLVLTSGKILSSEAAMVILEDKAIITGGDESNYIIGPVMKRGTADALFLPIGSATKYAPMEVSEITNSAGEMTITYYSDPPPFGTEYSIDESTLNSISMIQHWKIQRTAGVEDLDYTLHWMDQTANGINDTSGIVVAGLEGKVYTSYGKETVNSNGTVGSVTSAFSDPPPFGTEYVTIGSTKASNALPVELTKFQAVQQDQEVYLQWETATEIRTSHFEVQHAIDADNFNTIETIFAKGDYETNQAYACVDKSPANGMNYYRLKIVDIDGSYEYSQVQMAKFDTEETINIFPNPVDKEININGAESFGKNATIKVFDTTGREIYSGEIEINGGSFQISTHAINVNSRGTYFLQITSASNTKDFKFIKLN